MLETYIFRHFCDPKGYRVCHKRYKIWALFDPYFWSKCDFSVWGGRRPLPRIVGLLYVWVLDAMN